MSSSPPRLRPPSSRPLRGLAFETWVFWMALAVALPALVAVGEVIWEVNALGQTLREQRLRVEETLALLTKVLANVDIAIFTFDASQRLRLINPAGARLLAIAPDRAQGKTAAELGLTDCL